MIKFRQNKLWKDKAVDQAEQQGSRIHWKKLDDAEYDKELRKKLLEEAQEAARQSSRDNLITELADVFEVIHSLCDVHDISLNEIETAVSKKRADWGDFSQRKYVEIAEHIEGSFWYHYCKAEPNKYPEIED
jgi:predicted house-cleaning noncanonical NTP pyrophosphatase (MazG superfamily)